MDGGEGTPTNYYGYTVAIDADTALIGAYRDGDFLGRAFVFRWDPITDIWNQEAILELGLQEIYPTVALSGQTAVIVRRSISEAVRVYTFVSMVITYSFTFVVYLNSQ